MIPAQFDYVRPTTVDEALQLHPDAVLLSPGPGRPETSGIICEAIGAFADAGTPVP